MNTKLNRILWGIVLVAVGVLLGLNALDVLTFDLFFKGWWTLFIIVPSVIGLLTDKNKWGAFIGLLFGVFFLLCAWDILSVSLLWKLALPIVAVLVGLSLLFGKRKQAVTPPPVQVSPPPVDTTQTPNNNNRTDCVAIFSGQEMHCDGKPFCGVDATAIFGSVDVFAATAIITADCTVNATALFGGVDIYLPPNVNVQVISSGIFGDVENHRRFPAIEGAPTVTIHATAIFGGVDIK